MRTRANRSDHHIAPGGGDEGAHCRERLKAQITEYAWAAERPLPFRSRLLRRRTDRAPSDSRPETPTPGGMSILSSTSPVSRIDPPHITLIAFPGAVPEVAVDPGDPGDKAVRLDGAKNRPRFRIDLMDFPVAILPHPERPFSPREPRVTAATRCRDRGEHTAGVRIDLLDVIGSRAEIGAGRRTPFLRARRH